MQKPSTAGLLDMLGYLGVAGYAATHALPGTGALRTVFLLFCLAYWVRHGSFSLSAMSRALHSPAGCALGLLTVWLGFRAVSVWPDSEVPFKGFAGEWGKILLLAILGASIGLRAHAQQGRYFLSALFVGYFLHALSTLAYQIGFFTSQGKFDLGQSFFGNYGYVSALVDAAFTILLADLLQRLRHNRALLLLSNIWVGVMLALALAATLLLRAKGSIVAVAFLSLVFIGALLKSHSRYRKHALFAVFAVLIASAALSLRIENRWQNLSQSVAYATDIEHNRAWLDNNRKLAADIDESFYLRTAWFKVGLEGVAKYPFGLGYGSDAFGRYIQSQYNTPDFVSSHSGWLDFTLANGLPGLLLLLTLGGVLVHVSWQCFTKGEGAVGFSLGLLTFNFYLRGLLDGHFSSSRLMAFALIAGLLWGLSTPKSNTDATLST